MSTLKIQFSPYTADSGPASIPVEVIGEDLVRVWFGSMQLEQPVHVDVNAGSYLIRAHLPNGEIVIEQQQVQAGETVAVDLQPQLESPREELSWVVYLRSAVYSEGIYPQGTGPQELSAFDSGQGPQTGPVQRLSTSFWEYGPGGQWQQSPWLSAELLDAVPLELAPDSIRRFQVLAHHIPVWLRLEYREYSRFVALPVHADSNVDVAIVTGPDLRFRTEVKSSDPAAEALLTFMTTGDFRSARAVGGPIIDSAEQMLRAKLADPIAATIAGYFILRAGRLERLHDWTFDLANWFPMIPDGAVIAGWHVLKQDGDVRRARGYFLQARERGLPLFTVGTGLLVDGLRVMLAQDPKDDDVGQALEWVGKYAVAADTLTNVTSFAGLDPATPRPPEEIPKLLR